MQSVQRLLGCILVFHRIRRIQLLGYQWLLIGRQMIQYIAPLVDLAALDQRRLASMALHRRVQRLAAI